MFHINELERNGFLISTDKARLDIPLICRYLSEESYWAQGRALALIERSIANSMCFGIYQGDQQAGFARMVTDYATFAWLCDVFVLDTYRGHGLGKWLVEVVTAHFDELSVARILLKTRDADELYRRYGNFETVPDSGRFMIRFKQP